MPYVIIRYLWPPSKNEEIIKKAIEIRKTYPPDKSLAELKVNASTLTIEGARGLLVSEVKKGKLEEFLERLRKGLVMFSEVEGATASVEIWNTQIEAFASLGRKPPEELKVD